MAVLDRFEEETAVLRFNDGQELVVPVDALPESAQEGTSINVLFSEAPGDTSAREQRARELLTEILQGE